MTLAVQHSDNFVSYHQRNCEFRSRGFGGANIAGVLTDVWSVNGVFLEGGSPGNSLVDGKANRVFFPIPADLGANEKLLRLLIEQENGDVGQVKIVARDLQDPLQDLIEVERGEDGLPR